MNDLHIQPAVEALQGPLPRPSVPFAYRVGLVLVAIAMVLLPLIYVGLILAVGYALYLYLGLGPAWFELGSGGGGLQWRFLGFLAPLVAGVILILFMIKPLFARRAAAMEPLTLERSRQQDLFDFVDRLCDIVGAPRPRRIDVDCNVNASAAFEGGGWGLAARRLALTIGLPLAVGLDLRGLAGVLAHEFGHFAQGTGMRLSYVIRSVNAWFARVVYERDAWDEKLEESAARSDLRIGLILHLSRFFVWSTRRVLWALMMVGHGISCYMLRQMEFDADRYEGRLSGAEAFERTMLRFQVLNAAAGQAYEILGRYWGEARLPEDLPQLIVRQADRLPSDVEAKLREQLHTGKTGFFDTHPADAQRIARVRSESGAGIFRVEAPAATLFHGLEALSREATFKYYRDVVGEEVEGASLVPVAELLEADTALRDQLASIERVFPGGLSIVRPLWLPEEVVPWSDWEGDRKELRERGRTMRERASRVEVAFETYGKEDERRMKAIAAHTLLEAEVRVDPGGFDLKKASVASADQAIAEADEGQAYVTPEVDAHLETAEAWLRAALRILSHPSARERVGGVVALERDTAPMLRALSCLRSSHPDFLALRTAFIGYASLLHNTGNRIQGEALKVLERLIAELTNRLQKLRDGLDEPYPFEHARGPIPIGQQVVGAQVASRDDLGALYTQAGGALERYLHLYFRLIGTLIRAAEELERELDRASPSDPAM